MTNAFGINDSEIFARHRASMAASLSHRLEVAKANQNMQLISLLEREQEQLRLNPSSNNGLSELASWAKGVWQKFGEAIACSSKLYVERIRDDSGLIWWYAYDPRTGKALYAESQSEVVKWIEDNRLGR